jgi:hypothetical protein
MYSDGSMFFLALAGATIITAVVFGLFRVLKYKVSYKFLIGFGVSLTLLFLTFQKINKMNILLGNSEGREASSRRITRKWHDVYQGKNSSRQIPMLCFESDGEVCVEVGESVWQSKREGESFTVYSAPGDNEYHHPTGVYLSEGNLSFDYGLLTIETLAALFCLVKILFPGFLAFDMFRRSNTIKIFDETGRSE